MRFTHEGRQFAIEFQRTHKEILDPRTPALISTVKAVSTYPYTTARIIEIDPKRVGNRRVYLEATVGCWHKETKFTKEQGRVKALQAITRQLGDKKAFKEAMWNAYIQRNSPKNSSLVVEGEIVQEAVGV
jgi:hypothetical protein